MSNYSDLPHIFGGGGQRPGNHFISSVRHLPGEISVTHDMQVMYSLSSEYGELCEEFYMGDVYNAWVSDHQNISVVQFCDLINYIVTNKTFSANTNEVYGYFYRPVQEILNAVLVSRHIDGRMISRLVEVKRDDLSEYIGEVTDMNTDNEESIEL